MSYQLKNRMRASHEGNRRRSGFVAMRMAKTSSMVTGGAMMMAYGHVETMRA